MSNQEMQVDIQELRLGNWVYYQGAYAVVSTINNNYVGLNELSNVGEFEIEPNLEEVEVIKIDEFMLKMLGFNKNKYSELYSRDFGYKLEIAFDLECIETLVQITEDKKILVIKTIRFVHQLQNLMTTMNEIKYAIGVK